MELARKQKIRGTLLGLAWGDVLGCPVEYWSKDLIAEVFGHYNTLPSEYPLSRIPKDKYIREHLRPLGLHSDDTQQALTLIQVCLHSGGWQVERWADYLLSGDRGNAWRGTGRNFRTALENLSKGGSPLRCGSPSAGIGGAMRIAPMGALYRTDLTMLERVVFESTYTTHADVRAVSLALAVAACCALLIRGTPEPEIRVELPMLIERFEKSLLQASDVYIEDISHCHAVSSIVREVLSKDWPSLEGFRGWLRSYAQTVMGDAEDLALVPNHPFALVGGIHALCVGFWPNSAPGELLANVIQQGGDADTVGAITGAILGARYGTDWIPIDRMLDAANLSAYAGCLENGNLPERFSDFIQRESHLSSIEGGFRSQIGDLLKTQNNLNKDQLTERDKAFIERVNADLERRSKFPADMGFYPFSNKFAEGVELKAPWLPAYYSFRGLNKQASRAELLQYLEQHSADGTVLMDRYRGALLGLMVGDALGVPLEFSARDSKTVSGIIGGGPFNLKPGYWTDDTSMACCLAYSLIKCKGFDARRQMECYSYWYRYGAYSPTSECFDIGVTTRRAIEQFLATGEPYAGSTDPSTAGNGSLMRLVPVVLFYFGDFEKAVDFAAKSSMTTHQAAEAVDACRYFAALLYGALTGVDKDALLDGSYSPIPGYWQSHPLAPAIQRIALGSYKHKSRDQISSSGYVVHTLEAALWAFYRNDDFGSGILEAVNLADDADTVGAVCGQLAGAFYGETGIPIDWIRHTHASHGCYHFAQDLFAARNAS